MVWRVFPFERFIQPCTKPITYSLGTFDQRFHLSENDFLSALTDAEAIWEQPIGKNLFTYTPGSDRLTVNLVYDYRQQVTQELSHIQGSVKGDEAGYRLLEVQYQGAEADYQRQKSSYDAYVSAFNTENAHYEQDVIAWDSSNHTSKSKFNALESERLALDAEMKSLQAEEVRLNSKVKALNTLVDKLNSLARTLNLNVKEYNNIGASRGDTFAGGVYTSDANGERIDIFEFSSHD